MMHSRNADHDETSKKKRKKMKKWSNESRIFHTRAKATLFSPEIEETHQKQEVMTV